MIRYFFAATCLAAPAWAEPPKVVADIAPVHSIVTQIMAGAGTPDRLLPPGASPHDYALRPSEARLLSSADLVIWVGEGLTPWLEKGIDSLAANAQKMELMDVEGLTLREFDEDGEDDHHEEHAEHEEHEDHADHDEHKEAGHKDDHHDEHAHEEHAEHEEADHHKDEHGEHEEHAEHSEADDHDHHAHAHGGTDPHLWLDPENARIWASAIAEQIAELDPENADLYRSNASQLSDDVAATTAKVSAQLAPYSSAPLMFLHDAFGYFVERFDLSVAGSVSESDATDPSPARLSELQEMVRSEGVACAFAEPQLDSSALEVALEGSGTQIGRLDPIGVNLPEGASYTGLIEALADSIESCLSKAS